MSASLQPAPRPREIVRAHLERELGGMASADGPRRLPTISQLAEHLGVGATTVRAVYNELAEQGLLVSTPGRGTFLVGRDGRAAAMGPDDRVILINRSECEGLRLQPNDTWGLGIHRGVVHGASERNWLLTTLPDAPVAGNGIAAVHRRALQMASGCVLFPSTDASASQLAESAVGRGVRVVRINPHAMTATANFVSSDFYDWGFRLGRVWRKAGRKRLLVAFNISPDFRFLIHWCMPGCARVGGRTSTVGWICCWHRMRRVAGWNNSCALAGDDSRTPSSPAMN